MVTGHFVGGQTIPVRCTVRCTVGRRAGFCSEILLGTREARVAGIDALGGVGRRCKYLRNAGLIAAAL